ncbi:MAG TPA: hypothetical protein VK463_10030 [Desulfomonilaceae bacterium]|nr:hypothetical protein [Desulfomonilaceae bacterium]
MSESDALFENQCTRGPMMVSLSSFRVVAVVILMLVIESISSATGPVKEAPENCPRFSLPQLLVKAPFNFAGESVPIQRPDVRARILTQVNFLLLDARSVLTEWLIEKGRYSWLFTDLLEKEGIPPDFALLAPILSGSSLKSSSRSGGTGWWALDKPCSSTEGVDMSDDSWHDDRFDLELSTRCFASKLKKIRSEMGNSSWLMTAAAYVTSVKVIRDSCQRWNTDYYWDMPLPEAAEDLIVRWIALGIISGHREAFGLRFKDAVPFIFDQVNGLVLAKDLSVPDIARLASVSAREVMELNPKVKPSLPVFPATVNGRNVTHSIAAPKGKGEQLLKGLKKEGFVSDVQKP